MKRIITLFVCMLVLLPQLVFAEGAGESSYLTFYVSYEKGSDLNDGQSTATPFKTLEKAKSVVREKSTDMTGDIVVNLMDGYHFLEDTLYFSPQDSGKNGHSIIYRGMNMPIVSGGKKVTGFKKSDKGANIYEAYAPGFTHVSNIFVNESKRTRAASETMVYPIKYWNDPKTRYSDDGLYMKKSDIGLFENPEDIQFFWFQEWVQNYVQVEEIMEDPDNADNVIVRMDKQIWSYSNPSIDTKWRRIALPFYIFNAMELLDTPGECYYNKSTGMLYYIPMQNEDMETATVFVPTLEKLIDIYGHGTDEKVENITFEGIKFAHSTWEALATGSSTPRQAQSWLGWFNDISVVIPGAIELEMTENINFYDNRFFGLQQVGVYLKNGVEKTDMVGNAFYELGDAAFVVGLPGTYEKETVVDYLDQKNTLVDGKSPDVPKTKDLKRLINAGFTKIATSYWSVTEDDHKLANLHTSSSSNLFLRNWLKEEDYAKYRGTWKGNPDDVGISKSWVRYDLDRPYSISELTLTFDPGKTEPEQRKGYEVLLSNDKLFNEYETLAVQNEDSGQMVTFAVPEAMQANKYRYVMIRTLAETQLALSGAFFIAADMKPSIQWERCSDINFSNNLITCVGESTPCSGGLNIFSVTDMVASHNEITNLPYSAIMLGWGWSNTRELTKNIEVSHNRLENMGQLLHDGAGIYSLGRQPGTVVHDNVVKNPAISAASYYLDEGTACTEWKNNVSIGVNRDSFFLNRGTISNVIDDNYSDTAKASLEARRAENDLTEPVLFDQITNRNEKAEAIIAESGLTEAYRHIAEEVGERAYKKPYSYEIFTVTGTNAAATQNGAEARALELLATGDFGFKKGQLSNRYFFDLTRACAEYATGSKNEETEDVILTLNRRYESANEQDAEETSIWCVYADGAQDFSIRQADKAVTLRYPYKADLTNKSLTVYAANGKSVAYSFEQVDLNEPIQIPIYCAATKTYELWTLTVEQPTPAADTSVITGADWYSTKGIEAKTAGGGKYLEGSIYPYEAMLQAKNNTVSFAFVQASHKASGKQVFALGTAKKDICAELELEFLNGKANLYESYNGKRILLASEAFTPESKEANNVTYSVREEAENKTVFKLSVNGRTLFHSAVAHPVDITRLQYRSTDSGIIVY